jgi:H+/Cl- antiporter ClcA
MEIKAENGSPTGRDARNVPGFARKDGNNAFPRAILGELSIPQGSTTGMPVRSDLRAALAHAALLARWIAIAVPLGMVVGSAVAAFLLALDTATRLRFEHPWLLWLLPLAGAGIAWMYRRFGRSVAAGNDLVVDTVHGRGDGIPLRMAPLIFVGTVATHLCGGSAGREGTAVQMGAGIIGGLVRHVPWLGRQDVATLVMAGMAAGFGGVFGTPVAGTIFALEVLAIGRMRYAGILPCLAAAIASDQTCLAWGIGHTHYSIDSLLPHEVAPHLADFQWPLLAWAAGGGVLFGLTGMAFARLSHGIHEAFRRHVPHDLLRPVIGGGIVVALALAMGTRDYLGLGVSSPDPEAVTIATAFHAGGARPWSWLAKIVFTAFTLGSGFKGGEVTPLFFIGATLGNTLATLGGMPVDILAALGFVAVFAGATNTPLASTVMGVELFGGDYILYFAVACIFAYLSSGHAGIYRTQRIDTPKTHAGGA